MLPTISGGGARRRRTLVCGGLDRRPGAAEGTLRDGVNLSAADAPVLRARRARRRINAVSAPGGLWARDGLYWVDGMALKKDGVQVATLNSPDPKTLCALGARLAIFPDKLLYDTVGGTLSSLDASVTRACTFTDGTYALEPAEANTILAADPSFDWGTLFRPGDAVEISGAAESENNGSRIVREVDGPELRFYEFSFVCDSAAAQITVARSVPDLDFLCENENRLWGCKGDTIYASKLGDPYNWFVYDGLSDDSWTVTVGSPGDFTGCCSFLGFPIFFKPDGVYKVYGSRPSNFELMRTASLGVAEGAGASLAVAGETLFYLSRAGVVAYGGGVASPVGAQLGGARYDAATAGSDGLRYRICLRDADAGTWRIHCYDPETGLWAPEDASHALYWTSEGGTLWFADAEGLIWQIGGDPTAGDAEDTVESAAVFNDFSGAAFDARVPSRLLLRLELAAGASVTLRAQYDSDGVWRSAAAIAPGAKRTVTVPLLPRRCDHWTLRLEGAGEWTLRELAREETAGK